MQSEFLRSSTEQDATYKDLGFLPGDTEMLAWRDTFREDWPGKQFELPPNNSEEIWEVPDNFPEPLRTLLKRAAVHERYTRPPPYSKIHARLDVRFLYREYRSPEDARFNTDVHFDETGSSKGNKSLFVYLWSSEKSTTTTLFSGNLSEKDVRDFSGATRHFSDDILKREDLSGESPLPGHLIVTERLVPHSSPTTRLRHGRSPRVFVRLHTWIEE